ncbi:hypothetical protein C4J81_18275 [Deltaproteobacteria bacterium Smac51]|nr:hypothetical protein C4J81_18275 [Deltaproteobacteria bacterium Smac51]
MSETKRRTKKAEPDTTETASAPRQTRVTLARDVSSKYRKVMPRPGGGAPSGRGGRSGGGEDGAAPPRRRGPGMSSGPDGGSRPRAPRRPGGRDGSFSSGPEGGRPPRPPRDRSMSSNPDRDSRSRAPRPGGAAPGGRRGPATGGRGPSTGRAPYGQGRRDSLDPMTFKAIVHRELPEAARQIKEIQELILSTAEAMLGLTEQLGDCHGQLKDKLAALAAAHQHLGGDFEPLNLDVESAQGAVTGIFEKMSFQDLIGQRLMKVDSFLKSLDEIMKKPPRESSPDRSRRPAPRRDDDRRPAPRRDGDRKFSSAPAKPRGDKSRLKGPQAAGGGMDQSDIDAILSDL